MASLPDAHAWLAYGSRSIAKLVENLSVEGVAADVAILNLKTLNGLLSNQEQKARALTHQPPLMPVLTRLKMIDAAINAPCTAATLATAADWAFAAAAAIAATRAAATVVTASASATNAAASAILATTSTEAAAHCSDRRHATALLPGAAKQRHERGRALGPYVRQPRRQ